MIDLCSDSDDDITLWRTPPQERLLRCSTPTPGSHAGPREQVRSQLLVTMQASSRSGRGQQLAALLFFAGHSEQGASGWAATLANAPGRVLWQDSGHLAQTSHLEAARHAMLTGLKMAACNDFLKVYLFGDSNLIAQVGRAEKDWPSYLALIF